MLCFFRNTTHSPTHAALVLPIPGLRTGTAKRLSSPCCSSEGSYGQNITDPSSSKLLPLSGRAKFSGAKLPNTTHHGLLPRQIMLSQRTSRFIWLIFYSSYKTEAVGKVHSRQGWKNKAVIKLGAAVTAKAVHVEREEIRHSWHGQASHQQKKFPTQNSSKFWY